jgi:uncharacterized membrane protein
MLRGVASALKHVRYQDVIPSCIPSSSASFCFSSSFLSKSLLLPPSLVFSSFSGGAEGASSTSAPLSSSPPSFPPPTTPVARALPSAAIDTFRLWKNIMWSCKYSAALSASNKCDRIKKTVSCYPANIYLHFFLQKKFSFCTWLNPLWTRLPLTQPGTRRRRCRRRHLPPLQKPSMPDETTQKLCATILRSQMQQP